MAAMLFVFKSPHTADIFLISVVLPQILEEFNITYTVAGLIFTATSFMAVAFYLFLFFLIFLLPSKFLKSNQFCNQRLLKA